MEVSDIEWEISILKRMVLFQSLEQLLSFLIFFIFSISISLLVICALPGDFHGKIVMIIPAAVMSFFPLYGVFPRSFVIRGAKCAQVKSCLSKYLNFLGYVKADKDDTSIYQSKLPKFLSWKENRVMMYECPEGVKIILPNLIAKRIRQSCIDFDNNPR